MSRGNAAKARSDSEKQNYGKIHQCLLQRLLFAGVEKGEKRLRAAAHVADTHGACVNAAVHLVKGLHLKRTDEGNKRVRKGVCALRQKAHAEKQRNFHGEYYLAPVDFFVALKAAVYPLRSHDSQKERKQRHYVFYAVGGLSGKEVCTHQHNVARLGVRKNFSAAAIGVCVLKSAG